MAAKKKTTPKPVVKKKNKKPVKIVKVAEQDAHFADTIVGKAEFVVRSVDDPNDVASGTTLQPVVDPETGVLTMVPVSSKEG